LIHRQKRHRPDLTPHVILVDGNGILHERKAGLATFVGVTMNVPTIGVAKTLYCMDGLSVKMVESQVAWSLDRLAQYCCGCGYGYDSGCLLAGKNSKDGNNNAGDSRSPEAVCIFCKTPISPIRTDVCVELLEGKRTDGAVIAALEAIKEYCDGLSIPLMGNQGQILGAALVGHGGKIASGRAKRKKQCGTKNPIYISIGHDISLQEAVVLCCALSLARIPEPIRQADLIGREIMKNYKRL
jgi:Deoxyinosine 3''endonuclease (endonuclease V)